MEVSLANKIPQTVTDAIEQLPANGEITYDAWKDALYKAKRPDLVAATRAAKQLGMAIFRLQPNDDGTLTLMVSRAKS